MVWLGVSFQLAFNCDQFGSEGGLISSQAGLWECFIKILKRWDSGVAVRALVICERLRSEFSPIQNNEGGCVSHSSRAAETLQPNGLLSHAPFAFSKSERIPPNKISAQLVQLKGTKAASVCVRARGSNSDAATRCEV